MDAHKTKQQLIDELQATRRELAAARRKEKALQAEKEKFADVYTRDDAHVGRANMVGEISASLAHELNQPLTAILANAQSIKHQIPASSADFEETVEIISDVIDDARRAAEVIRRLRSVSERRKKHNEFTDINLLIVGTEELLRSQLTMSQSHLELELDSTLPLIFCDPIQMQQVLLNILINAVDATALRDPSDRRIQIRTRHLRSGGVEISIIDSGTGMMNMSYRKLVQPFFTTKEDRIGMGLTISKSILQNIGGRIWAKNNQGPGATFYVILPSSDNTAAISRARHVTKTKPDFQHDAKVFIIDDDVSIRRALSRLIRAAGYPSETFSSAEEFKQRTEHVGVGCMVVDLHMPGASGLDLQHDVKSRKCQLPIIFVTGGGDTESGVRAMKQGAADFLSKPVDEEQLLTAISVAIETSHEAWEEEAQLTAAQAKVAKLTPREIEIMDLIVEGRRNKQIAGMLGISEKTVKVHRGHVMKKFGALTVTDLVHVAEAAADNAQTTL